ncbi:WYL domain-containing protein [bacterium]|nr:WYL domain-containing protein [bacterium]
MDAFERRWNILKMLLTGPLFRGEVLSRLLELSSDYETDAGLSEASISADVKALRKLGIGFRPLGPGDKLTKQAYELDMGHLELFANNEEAAALQTAVALFEDLKLPEAERLRTLFERVPASVREGLSDPYTGRLLRTGNTAYDAQVLDSLQHGIQTGRMMRLTYRPLNREPKRYLVDRAYLTWQDGFLYLHAHCPEAEGSTEWHKNREFRLDRFCSTKTSPAVEVLDTPVSLDQVPAFEFQIWLSASMASGFQRVPQRLRVLEETPDGSRLVAIKESIPLRAVRRILSYGGQARVVEPDFVVAEVQATIARMASELAPTEVNQPDPFKKQSMVT